MSRKWKTQKMGAQASKEVNIFWMIFCHFLWLTLIMRKSTKLKNKRKCMEQNDPKCLMFWNTPRCFDHLSGWTNVPGYPRTNPKWIKWGVPSMFTTRCICLFISVEVYVLAELNGCSNLFVYRICRTVMYISHCALQLCSQSFSTRTFTNIISMYVSLHPYNMAFYCIWFMIVNAFTGMWLYRWRTQRGDTSLMNSDVGHKVCLKFPHVITHLLIEWTNAAN